jgi:hypothetical protein
MGATRFFIFSTFLVVMFGFALSLPTVGDPEQGNYKFSNFYALSMCIVHSSFRFDIKFGNRSYSKERRPSQTQN